MSNVIPKKFPDRVENKHGWMLVSHALAYVTASKNGISEPEIEDLISLDDKVLDDIYQYHLPPTRRIPPLLWTRVRYQYHLPVYHLPPPGGYHHSSGHVSDTSTIRFNGKNTCPFCVLLTKLLLSLVFHDWSCLNNN